MKQFSEDFLLVYYGEADSSLKLRHTALLDIDTSYAQAWTSFCAKMSEPQIASAQFDPKRVEKVLKSLEVTETKV